MIGTGETTGSSPTIIIFRWRLPCLILLLALPLLLGAKANAATDHDVCHEGFLEIVSPDRIGMDQCRQVAKMAMAAWDFDMKQMNWSPSIDIKRKLKLRLLSVERMRARNPGAYAIANGGGDLFIASTAVLKDRSAVGTFAHELGHVQAFRALGPISKTSLKATHYFLEGHGLIMNRLYADHLRISAPEDWTDNVGTVMSMSPNEARIIFADNSYAKSSNAKDHAEKVFKMESLGVYFVEYMRTRVHGRGIPDTVPKMGRVFELVGRGKTYGQAFKQVYGVWAGDVASEIVALFESTRANPAERYKATRFEPASQIVAKQSRKKGGRSLIS